MGTDKAFVELGGVAIAERVAAALEAAGCAPVLLVGGDDALLAPLGAADRGRRLAGRGPGGGVLTALRTADDELVVVAACDLPLLDAAAVDRLVDALVGARRRRGGGRTDRRSCRSPRGAARAAGRCGALGRRRPSPPRAGRRRPQRAVPVACRRGPQREHAGRAVGRSDGWWVS